MVRIIRIVLSYTRKESNVCASVGAIRTSSALLSIAFLCRQHQRDQRDLVPWSLTDKGFFGIRRENTSAGILFCSGMVAGEGIIGILLAILAVTGLEARLDLSGALHLGVPGGLVLLGILCVTIWVSGTKNK